MSAIHLMEECLRELYALVLGESPSLLEEDSGGNARLALECEDALAAAPAEITLADAAPELLEALQKCAHWMESYSPALSSDSLASAHAAIAKATGEAK